MANCGHLAACKNSQDFYKCVCPKGTVGKGYAWKRPCLDVDECNTGNACGEGASIPPEASDATVNKGSKLMALTAVKTSMNARFLQTR